MYILDGTTAWFTTSDTETTSLSGNQTSESVQSSGGLQTESTINGSQSCKYDHHMMVCLLHINKKSIVYCTNHLLD